ETLHAGLERRLLGRQLRAEIAIALLEPERLERPVADRLDAVLATHTHQRVPDGRRMPWLDGELPAELARVRQARREDLRRADVDGPRPALGQRDVVDGILRHGSEGVTGTRTP